MNAKKRARKHLHLNFIHQEVVVVGLFYQDYNSKWDLCQDLLVLKVYFELTQFFFQLKFNVIFCNKVYQDRDIFPRLIIWDIHRLTWVFIIWGRILQELLHHLLLAVLSIMDWEREHREFMCLLSSVECPDLMEYLGNVKKKGIFVGKWELNKIIGIYICRGSGPMYPPGHGYQGQQSLLHHQLQSLDPSLGIRPPHSQEYQSRYSISG